MTPMVRCVICGTSWYKGSNPLCQHSDQEWAQYREDCSKPEDDSQPQSGPMDFGKPEPDKNDAEFKEMEAQIWAAGATLEDAAFISRMLWRNGLRIAQAKEIEQIHAALKPFADLGVGSGPEDGTETYQITRKAIRDARVALERKP